MRPSPLASTSWTPGSASKPCWCVPHLPRKVETAPAEVAPVAHRAVHLQDVGQPVAKKIGELQISAGQGAGGQIGALNREELPAFRSKSGVAEFERREFF